MHLARLIDALTAYRQIKELEISTAQVAPRELSAQPRRDATSRIRQSMRAAHRSCLQDALDVAGPLADTPVQEPVATPTQATLDEEEANSWLRHTLISACRPAYTASFPAPKE
jgi:hypothetical protein